MNPHLIASVIVYIYINMMVYLNWHVLNRMVHMYDNWVLNSRRSDCNVINLPLGQANYNNKKNRESQHNGTKDNVGHCMYYEPYVHSHLRLFQTFPYGKHPLKYGTYHTFVFNIYYKVNF